MKSKVTFNVILDKRHISEKAEYTIKLRVTYRRISRLLTLGIQISETNFEKLYKSNLKDKKLLVIRDFCFESLNKAELIANSMSDFEFNNFKSMFFGHEKENIFPQIEPNQPNLSDYYKNYISDLKEAGRVSTYQSLSNSFQSLTKYFPNLQFSDINPKFLQEYENWMLNNENNSITTVGIYLRNLRIIINLAIEDGIFNKDHYPFGKRKYIIPNGRNIKKALNKEDLRKIINFEAKYGSSLDKARDFWLLSYFCNGLNLKDLCMIKIKDVHDDRIFVTRAKTKGSHKGNPVIIEIILHPKAQEIIKKWKSPSQDKEEYLFPILKKDYNPEKIRSKLQDFNKFINKYMRLLAIELKISKPVLFYGARHNFSTQLMKSGVPIEYISTALGHSSIQITSRYLGSFEDDKKKEFLNFLTDF
ncbi:MAG: site-specific integrase [Spirosomataceae bacterium]|jgi:integrase